MPMYTYAYVYTHTYVCVCVCVCLLLFQHVRPETSALFVKAKLAIFTSENTHSDI